MQEFSKYHSLIQYRQESANILKDTLGNSRCVVTEKIHGANFAIRTDGSSVVFSRRNGDLVEGESFYGYQYIKKELEEIMLELFKDTKEMNEAHHEAADEAESKGEPVNRPEIPRGFATITLRGELAGGSYPHPDVPQLKGEGNGQVGKGGIWYGQDKNFYAFALEVDGVEVDFYTLGAMCRSYGIPMVPVLFFGTFEECLAYSHEHLEDNSMVPSTQVLLDADGKFDYENPQHLPEILENVREGHVIQPVKPLTLRNGKAAVMKHKGSKYAEQKVKVTSQAPVDLPEHLQVILDELKTYITVNRMHAVISKEAEVDSKDFRRICGLVIQDALDEAALEITATNLGSWYASFTHLTAKDRKQLMKRLSNYTANELRSAFFS